MLENWLSSRGEVKSPPFWFQTRNFCPCLRTDTLGEFLVLKKKKKDKSDVQGNTDFFPTGF